MSVGLFGSVLSSHRVEAQLVDTLEQWTHTYIGEAERQNGVTVNTIPRPASYRRTAGQAVDVADHLLPRIVLRSSGWSDAESDGADASLLLAVTVAGFWKGRKSEETLDRIRVVEAGVRTLLFQKAAGGLITEVELGGGDYGVVDTDRENTLAGFEIELAVLVPAASTIHGGPTATDPAPTQPPAAPVDYGEAPTVADADPDITATPVPPGEELPE